MARQILFIHGGMTFKNDGDYHEFLRTRNVSIDNVVSWSGDYLDNELEDFQVIRPRMPLKDYAKYEDWKIHLERFIPLIEDNIILVGNSLGGIFLAKYLSENKFPKKIAMVCLVCPPFDDSLSGEDLAGGFELGDDLSLIAENCDNINLFFSKDDSVVPIEHAEKFREKLSDANIHIYDSKNGHFLIEEFPEIVDVIRSIE